MEKTFIHSFILISFRHLSRIIRNDLIKIGYSQPSLLVEPQGDFRTIYYMGSVDQRSAQVVGTIQLRNVSLGSPPLLMHTVGLEYVPLFLCFLFKDK